jgi:pheromone shutdown protein TraB
MKLLFFIVFIGIYFIINLTLLKYIFYLIDHEEDHLSIRDSLPTQKQIVNFLLGNLMFTGCILAVYIIVALMVFPFIYTGLNLQFLINFAISVGLVAIFITWIRISFFPFFIIDRNASPFTSLKFSLAITKGIFSGFISIVIPIS